jgi:hypothetical protein
MYVVIFFFKRMLFAEIPILLKWCYGKMILEKYSLTEITGNPTAL